MKIIFTILLILFSSVTMSNEHNHNEHQKQSKSINSTYSCPMHPNIQSHKEGECPICGMDLVLNKQIENKKEQSIYNCPMHPDISSHTEGKCSICGMFLVLEEPKKEVIDDKKELYSCPMHPNIKSHKEGECPICGMDLVLNKQTANTNHNNEINLKIQNFNVNTFNTKIKTINPSIKTFGKIEYNEDYIFHYHTRYKGWIEEANLLKEGMLISKGDLLFTVYSKELIEAQNDFLIAIRLDKDISFPKTRLEVLGIQEKTIKQIIKKQKPIFKLPFYAKKSGILVNLDLKEGMFIEPNKKLFSLIDNSKLWVEGILFENDFIWADIGNSIKFNLDYLKTDIESTISYIYPNIDDTKAIKFRAEINNIKDYIKQGLHIEIEVFSESSLNGIFIPYSALIQTEKNNTVIVKDGDYFTIKEVEIGFINITNNTVLIENGLSENENVVTKGQFLIDAEASIQGLKLRNSGENNE
jgi:Cu(I)/Ag(I) efflux system membrane fusion protein